MRENKIEKELKIINDKIDQLTFLSTSDFVKEEKEFSDSMWAFIFTALILGNFINVNGGDNNV